MLNLQPYRFFYAAQDAHAERRAIEAKWAAAAVSPLAVKAKMYKLAGLPRSWTSTATCPQSRL